MIREIWEQIMKGQDVRQNLSALRQEIKEHGTSYTAGAVGWDTPKDELAALVRAQEETFCQLLYHEDAKTRKNAALLLGDLGLSEVLDSLYQAYEREEQLFVKGSYLTAMRSLDYSTYIDKFKARLKELGELVTDAGNEKHIREEMRELSALVVAAEGISRHKFTGWNQAYQVVLLTNRNFPELTLDKLMELEPEAQAKVFGAGVMAKVNHLSWVGQIRTYQELLFAVEGMQNCPMDADEAAKILAFSGLLAFLERSHEGGTPYYFRLEVKSRMELDKRSVFSKKLSGQLEKLSKRKLINSPSDYEFEIRLIENKEGSFNVLVKLYTLEDKRFTYRKETVAVSMKPVNAALVMELAREYLKEDGQVLDPFCGTGVMLIERHKAVAANTSYGIDILGDAVEKARENAESARQVIHFINRDFFEFEHEYLFDEIITDMPFAIGRITEEEIETLYRKFFKKAATHMKSHGTIILYSHNKDFVKKYAKAALFRTVECFECSKREGTYVFVLKAEA